MSRQNFTEGQEILHTDLNSLQSRMERGLYDQVIYELIGRKTDGFFQGGLKVLYTSATSVTVKAGLGFQSFADSDIKEPTKKPIYLVSDLVVNITAAHATLPRKDIICVKANLANLETQTRRFKEEFVDTIFTADFVISKQYGADILYTAGTAAGSPVAPATPDGYLKLAEVLVTAVSGVTSQGSITDSRSLLPFSSNSTYGGKQYDAVVGSDSFCTHATLNEVMADLNAASIKSILVTSHPALTASQVINQNDVKIEFKKGSSLVAGSYSTTGLTLSGDGCEILGGKFSGFTTGILISASKKNNMISRCRFTLCTTDITDSGDNNDLSMNMVEV